MCVIVRITSFLGVVIRTGKCSDTVTLLVSGTRILLTVVIVSILSTFSLVTILVLVRLCSIICIIAWLSRRLSCSITVIA